MQRLSVPIPSGKQRLTVLTLFKEAEAHCSTAIREACRLWELLKLVASNSCTPRPSSVLEEEAIEEESKGQLNFLSTCQAALEAQSS